MPEPELLVPFFVLLTGIASLWYAASSLGDRSITMGRYFRTGSRIYTLGSEPVRFGCSVLAYVVAGGVLACAGAADLWSSARAETWILLGTTTVSAMALWDAIAQGRPRATEFLVPLTDALARRDLPEAARLLPAKGGALPRLVREVLDGPERAPKGGAYRGDADEGDDRVRSRLPGAARRQHTRVTMPAAAAVAAAMVGVTQFVLREPSTAAWELAFAFTGSVLALVAALRTRRTRRDIEHARRQLGAAVDGRRSR